MTVFLMGVLTVLALPFVLWPLLRPGAANDLTRREMNVLAYRSRLLELEQDVALNLLPADEIDAMKQELASRLLDDAGDETSPEADSAETSVVVVKPRPQLAALLSVCVLLVAALTWFMTDGPRHFRSQPTQAALDPQNPDPQAVANMADSLRDHLDANPEDLEGWLLLARTRTSLGEPAAAADAWSKANDLSGRNEADWLVAEGEARTLSSGRDLQGRPDALFREALKLQPMHQKGLWYAGLSAFQREDYDSALNHWTLLKAQPLPERLAAVLTDQIAEASRRAGQPVPKVETPPVTGGDAASGEAAVRIRLRVEISDELAADMDKARAVFVFARAVGGAPMPLAATRMSPGDLPRDVELTDAMAMVPGMSLSRFDRWEVVARVSFDDEPTASSGDFEGRLELGRPDLQRVQRLVIDRRVP